MQYLHAVQQSGGHVLGAQVAGGAVLTVVEHFGLAHAGLLEHDAGAVVGVVDDAGTVHALGTELIADEAAKLVGAQAADPGGLQAQLCQTHGYIALGTGGADAEVLHIAQGTHAVRGEGGHGLADGDQLRHK